MSLFHAVAARRGPQIEEERVQGIPMRVIRSLGAAMVPVHGFVVGTKGLVSAGSPWRAMKSKIWDFVKQLARGCAWAAAIAAGMLVYTSFTQKWKEKGYPTIPISALVAADQATNRQMPLPGLGGSTYQGGTMRSSTTTTTTSSSSPRQASLLDLDEYQG